MKAQLFNLLETCDRIEVKGSWHVLKKYPQTSNCIELVLRTQYDNQQGVLVLDQTVTLDDQGFGLVSLQWEDRTYGYNEVELKNELCRFLVTRPVREEDL